MSEPYIRDLGFLELFPGREPIVDIVAIHGLNGDRKGTWETDAAVLWLRDFLSKDIPNARILSYGYDADTHSAEAVSTTTMRQIAQMFADALSRKRRGVVQRRPIIFIAHDLGGIILKWALSICYNERSESNSKLWPILVSTHAILFFGTPHSGVKNILETVKRLASGSTATRDIILKNLEAHSEELEDVQQLYMTASEEVSSIFFSAGYASPSTGNQGAITVPYHSAVIAGDRNARPMVLNTDHRNLVRFRTQGDDSYQTVLYYLEEYLEDAPAAVSKKWLREGVAGGEPVNSRVQSNELVDLGEIDPVRGRNQGNAAENEAGSGAMLSPTPSLPPPPTYEASITVGDNGVVRPNPYMKAATGAFSPQRPSERPTIPPNV